ncbi:MAG TPA: hypothetical protein VN256_10410 [Pyrinomonadaceae bacterium]|nr:hypothetical protein [Pyrinomonadaceae bacterium]
MHLIQLLLPLYDNEKRPFAREHLDRVRAELTEGFGGVTAFRRSPAEGVWKDGGEISRDEIIIFEVMAEQLDRTWWADYRADLEKRFRQEELIIRATETEQL